MDFYDNEPYDGYSFEDTIPDYEVFERNQLALDRDFEIDEEFELDDDEEDPLTYASEPEEDRTFFLPDEGED